MEKFGVKLQSAIQYYYEKAESLRRNQQISASANKIGRIVK